LCGKDDKRIIAVHHIDKNRSNNKLKNLAWLCYNCHFLVHHYSEIREKFLLKI
jgi:predicted HNH restriction endonuclease